MRYYLLILGLFTIGLISLASFSVSLQKQISFEKRLALCNSIPNGSVRTISENSKVLINLPKSIYPDKYHNLNFKTILGNVTSGYIPNGRSMGESFRAQPGCWSYYNEFDGEGELDLTVPSAIKGMPDYSVRFIVVPAE